MGESFIAIDLTGSDHEHELLNFYELDELLDMIESGEVGPDERIVVISSDFETLPDFGKLRDVFIDTSTGKNRKAIGKIKKNEIAIRSAKLFHEHYRKGTQWNKTYLVLVIAVILLIIFIWYSSSLTMVMYIIVFIVFLFIAYTVYKKF